MARAIQFEVGKQLARVWCDSGARVNCNEGLTRGKNTINSCWRL
ncbi:hypothetical protein [Janibacter cremeus]|uniref:Uncharacterized protein n=1 Tax=Janibacter cremeus TaxID=1285192 RepID=A0A852VTN8_9MICO|nr:hypothetical protein [Janibacter cremeus]NYF96941.1 hypothetical protein [Janibacter cremeus]